VSNLAAGVVPSHHGDIPILEMGKGGQAAVIVLHQAGGVSEQTEETVEALAGEGFWAIAPDLFYRKQGEAIPFPTGPDGFLAFDRWLGGDTDLRADIGAVLDYILSAGIPAERIAIVGFSYGGRAAFLGATEWKLGAVVSYYANGVERRSYLGNDDLLPLSRKPLLTPWLGLYGDSDFFIAAGELDELARDSRIRRQRAKVSTAL
jgi:carboxymethylenebutenolidase